MQSLLQILHGFAILLSKVGSYFVRVWLRTGHGSSSYMGQVYLLFNSGAIPRFDSADFYLAFASSNEYSVRPALHSPAIGAGVYCVFRIMKVLSDSDKS